MACSTIESLKKFGVIDMGQSQRHDRNVPTAMLYGRVVEFVDMSVDELQQILQRMVGVR